MREAARQRKANRKSIAPNKRRRRSGYSTKKKKKIQLLDEEEEADHDGERSAVGRRTRRTRTERGRLLGEEEEVDLAWRKVSCSVKKQKQILCGERSTAWQRRRSKSCMEKGRLLGVEEEELAWKEAGHWAEKL
ncbi:hypothetical protein SLEP1_g44846 [Rubroshorea leprosula]|uniref:Uncharacterized protein n=1 Tax=Rubroshorea leprosula TaxID=152421 RepID=A0AAV5LI00_9ROSI|nr:hypothetical protein SLEP1_g44846 [Rubroshorea leprosula]